MAIRHNRFSRNNNLCKCRACGKVTHSSIDGSVDIQLCRACYDLAGLENEHSDGWHDENPNPECPECKATHNA